MSEPSNSVKTQLTPTVFETSSKRRLVGVYGTIDLSWKNMLYLNLTGRNDWSSTLAPKERSFFYPSVSVSWVFTELLGSDMKDVLS
jgi:hypothetical protein